MYEANYKVGDFVNKNKCLKVSLSLILGTILIIPLTAIGINSIENVEKTTSVLNGNEVGGPPGDFTIPIDENNIKYTIIIHQNKLAPLTTDMVPKKGDNWNNYGSYVTFKTDMTNLSFGLWTEALDVKNHKVELGFNGYTAYHSKDFAIGYHWVNLSTKNQTPTFKGKNVASILPSVISNDNFNTYVEVIDPDKTILSASTQSDNANGKLTITGTYRETSYTYSDKLTKNFSTTITGFARPTNAPSMKAKSNIKEILPSKVNKDNYQNYITVTNASQIADVEWIHPHNSTGKLELRVKFYTTTYHTNGAPADYATFNFSNFATSSTSPVVTNKSNDDQILPSQVTNANYSDYLNVTNISSIIPQGKVPNEYLFKLTPDDVKGNLDVRIEYYTTSYHGTNNPPTNWYSYELTGFAELTTKGPSITINQANISEITENTFESKIVENDPVLTLNQLSHYVYINDFDVNKIAKITYSNEHLKVYYYKTSYAHSPTPLLYSEKLISGFSTAGGVPSFQVKPGAKDILPTSIDSSNFETYLKIFDNDERLIESDMHFSGNNFTGVLMVTGTYYSTSVKTATAPKLEYSYSFPGFRIGDIRPAITTNDNVNEVLASYISPTNYSKYLNVIDDDLSLIPGSMKFTSDDLSGSLLLEGSYYSTSSHNEGSPTSEYSFSFTGFDLVGGPKSNENLYLFIGAIASVVALLILISVVSWLHIKKKKAIKLNKQQNKTSRQIRVNRTSRLRLGDRKETKWY